MLKFTLQNLDCPNCAAKLEEGLKKLDCVQVVTINFATLSMNIETNDLARVQAEIHAIEPDIRLIALKNAQPAHEDFAARRELLLIIVSAVIFIAGLIFQLQLEQTPYHVAEYLVFMAIYLLTGWNVLWSAIRNIVKGRVFNEHFLMSVATLGAIAVHALT